jgi:type II secretory pathway predicted ATPase ExeA
MYEAFYQLTEKPFSLLPDPSMLYLSRQHGTAYSLLDYGVQGHAGFVVITGEVGCGKTTLLRHLLTQLPQDVTVGLISNTAKAGDDLLKWVLLAFGQDYSHQDPVELHQRFETFLIDQYASGKRVVLIVDEAQHLPVDTLEELRMLSNINADKDQLLQIILTGQPELQEKLERPELRQFAQRIGVNYHLKPLTSEETPRYIRHRLERAGGDPALFTDQAIALIHAQGRGIPRLINGLCDLALVYGYADGAHQIDEPTVRTVIDDQQGQLRHQPDLSVAEKQTAKAGTDESVIAIFDRNLARELFSRFRKK